MPYNKITELPPNIKKSLPVDAQRVWMRVFNTSLNSCTKSGKKTSDCEDLARISAWVAVKNGWKKDKDGNWKRKKT